MEIYAKAQDIGKHFILDGDITGSYIDYLEYGDVKYPIMWGTDRHRRRFVTLKLILTNGDDKEYRVAVIHQRYTNNEDHWVVASSGSFFYNQLRNEYIEPYLLIMNGYAYYAGNTLTYKDCHIELAKTDSEELFALSALEVIYIIFFIIGLVFFIKNSC